MASICTLCAADATHPIFEHFPPSEADAACCFKVSDLLLKFSTVVLAAAALSVDLAYADVAKGIRMFARLNVPCVSVVEKLMFCRIL